MKVVFVDPDNDYKVGEPQELADLARDSFVQSTYQPVELAVANLIDILADKGILDDLDLGKILGPGFRNRVLYKKNPSEDE